MIFNEISGDTILTSRDTIGYEKNSFKLVGAATMTPNACLSPFKT